MSWKKKIEKSQSIYVRMCRPIRIDDEVRVLFGSDNVIAILKFQTNALISRILSPLNIDTLCTPFADWKPIKQKFELHYRFPMNFQKPQTNQTLNCDYAFVLLFIVLMKFPFFQRLFSGTNCFRLINHLHGLDNWMCRSFDLPLHYLIGQLLFTAHYEAKKHKILKLISNQRCAI